MSHSDAAKLASEKYPIYLEDEPEKGIKKTCPLEKMRLEWLREEMIKRLIKE